MKASHGNHQSAILFFSFGAGIVFWGGLFSLILCREFPLSFAFKTIVFHAAVSIFWFSSSKKKPTGLLGYFLFPLRTLLVTIIVIVSVWMFLL